RKKRRRMATQHLFLARLCPSAGASSHDAQEPQDLADYPAPWRGRPAVLLEYPSVFVAAFEGVFVLVVLPDQDEDCFWVATTFPCRISDVIFLAPPRPHDRLRFGRCHPDLNLVEAA